jgi:hypothetical protein
MGVTADTAQSGGIHAVQMAGNDRREGVAAMRLDVAVQQLSVGEHGFVLGNRRGQNRTKNFHFGFGG